MREVRPLPRKIMMAQHRRHSDVCRGDGDAGGRVQGERTEVLHYDQIGVGQGVADLADAGCGAGAHGQAGQHAIGVTLTGHRVHLVPQLTQCPLPFGRLHRDAVGAGQPVGDDGSGRHRGAL